MAGNTTLTRKQVNVIYINAGKGLLGTERWVISRMYLLADGADVHECPDPDKEKRKIRDVVDLIFAQNLEGAQKALDEYTQETWARFPDFLRVQLNRDPFGRRRNREDD